MEADGKSFPTRAPVGLIFGLALGLLSVVATFVVWRHALPPLQSFYLKTYLTPDRSDVFPSFKRKGLRAKRYKAITVYGRVATEQTLPLALPDAISMQYIYADPLLFRDWLRTSIYDGIPPTRLIRTPLLIAGCLFATWLVLGAYLEYWRKKKAREGQSLRGPEFITPRQFNRSQKKGDGLVIRLQ